MEIVSTDFVWFDLTILLLIGVSAAISFAKGLVREVFSIVAFIAGAVGTFLGLGLFRDEMRDFVPEGWPDFVSDGLLLILGFVFTYVICSWAGRKLKKLVHSIPEFGFLDRFGGSLFGGVRSGIIFVFVFLGVQQIFPSFLFPAFVTESVSYPILKHASEWTGGRLPGLYRQAREAVTDIPGFPAGFSAGFPGGASLSSRRKAEVEEVVSGEAEEVVSSEAEVEEVVSSEAEEVISSEDGLSASAEVEVEEGKGEDSGILDILPVLPDISELPDVPVLSDISGFPDFDKERLEEE